MLKRIKYVLMKNVGKCMCLMAFSVAISEANALCTFFCHQPELPESVKRLRKF